MLRIAPIALLALLPACGPKDTDPGPGGVTVAEARALDQAAEMLEQQRLPAAATADDSQTGPAAPPTASPSPASAPAQ